MSQINKNKVSVLLTTIFLCDKTTQYFCFSGNKKTITEKGFKFTSTVILKVLLKLTLMSIIQGNYMNRLTIVRATFNYQGVFLICRYIKFNKFLM